MRKEKHKILSIEQITKNRTEIKNRNDVYKQSVSFNEKLASRITIVVGSMYCAYVFSILAFVSLPDAVKGGTFMLISWIAQTFLQLVLLPIIMVGQKVESKRAELKANQDFEINKKHEAENEAILKHLENQNKDILDILKHLKKEK